MLYLYSRERLKSMKTLLTKEQKILEVLADIYIFIMIIIFPLIVDKTGFFHILECKWNAYVIISSMYIVANILVLLYFLFFKKIICLKKSNFLIVQWLAIGFWLINIISCFLSPFLKKYNLFIGVGRGEGLIVMSLYVITFLCVSLFAKFKRRYILYFSLSSILLNLVAILQYIGFNPFNMYQRGIGTHNVSFMTTIGNIDFISAMYCILLSISISAYIFLEDNKNWEKLVHIISILMGFFIIGIINVQSGKVAFLGTLIIILPFIVANNKRLSRFLVVISTILMAYCINIIINPEYHYDIHQLNLYFQFNYIVVLFFIVCGVLIFLARILNKLEFDISNNKKIIKYFYLGLTSMGVLCLIGVFFIKFKSGLLYEVHELLHGHFNDEFGTYRIFLWKRTLNLIPQFPILGSGPDTFAIRFMAKYSADVAAIGPLTINDTAANVYLTMIVNVGIIGLLDYLFFLFFQIKRGVKHINPYSAIFIIALICYAIQDFFNLSLVIVTPIFWLVMALHHKSLEKQY